MSVVRRSAVVVLAAALSLTACGSGSSGPKAAPKPTTNGIEKLEAKAILDKSVAAAKTASGAHVHGTMSDSGDVITLDMRFVAGKGAVGTMSSSGQTVSLLRIGTDAYMKGDKAFWTALANAQAAQLLADKYVKVPTTSPDFKDFLDFMDLGSVVDNLTPDGTLSKVGGKPVAGVATVGLKDDDPKTGGILYIANVGQPYPRLLEPTKPATKDEGMTFDEWDQPTTLTAPPAAQVIDLAKLTG